MISIRTLIAAACGLTLLAACATAARPDAIEKIMDKGFKKGGLRHQITTEVAKDHPDWAALAKKSKDFQTLVEQLAKQSPPKGDPDNWKTLTQTVLTEAKTLCESTEKKDQARAKDSLKKINSSCKSCHDAHRE